MVVGLIGMGGGGGSSDDFVNPITNGLALWLDADNDASFNQDAFTGEVNSWTSREGRGIVFSPVNAAANTRLVRIAKPNFQNRRVVVSELSANAGLVSPAYDIASNFAANGTDITVFAMVRSDEALQTFGTLYYHYTTGAIGHYFRIVQSSNNARFLCLSAGTPLAGSNANYLFGENIYCLKRTGNTLNSYINGKSEASAASTATPIVSTQATMFIGTSTLSGGGFHGDIAEIHIYARALPDIERMAVENYYAAKWMGL